MSQNRDLQKDIENWTFNPNKPRDEGLFSSFAKGDFAKEIIEQIEATPIGRRLVQLAYEVDPIIAFEDMPFYGLYIPAEHNLDPSRLNGDGALRSDRPMLLLDDKDLDKALLPYILAGQLYRLMQDRAEPQAKRMIPMFQHSIVYNPVGRIDYQNVFTRDYIDMERACDVVALSVLYQMHLMGTNTQAFGLMRAQEQTQEICDWMGQTGAYIEHTGMGQQDPQLAQDLLLYMGNLAAFQSTAYMEPLKQQAAAAFESTMENPGFAIIASQKKYAQPMDDDMFWDDDDGDIWDDEENYGDYGDDDDFEIMFESHIDLDSPATDDDDADGGEPPYTPPMHNGYHYELLSDTYQDRDWDPADWIDAINEFALEEKERRADQISEAFKIASENRKGDDGQPQNKTTRTKKPPEPKP